MNRRSVVSQLLRQRGDELIVTSLGNPTFDVAAAGDHPLNFYLWGAMGGAIMVGLGLALAQPGRRVIVFAGDGEVLMGLGSLATVAVKRSANLAIVVLDNEHYAETGMQASHAGHGVNIAAVAQASGFRRAQTVYSEAELEAARKLILKDEGPVLVCIKVTTESMPSSLPPRDGPFLRSRFREALLGARAHE
ncbi:MAG: thiamine pyrophosphate-dependent enzyme [Burkholderiaceae bacterium]